MKLPRCPKCKALGIDTCSTVTWYNPTKKIAGFQCLPLDKTAAQHKFVKYFNPSEKKDDAQTNLTYPK